MVFTLEVRHNSVGNQNFKGKSDYKESGTEIYQQLRNTKDYCMHAILVMFVMWSVYKELKITHQISHDSLTIFQLLNLICAYGISFCE